MLLKRKRRLLEKQALKQREAALREGLLDPRLAERVRESGAFVAPQRPDCGTAASPPK